MALFGLFFGLAGIVQDGQPPFDVGGAVIAEMVSLFSLAFGVALMTARAIVGPSEVDYRYGVIHRRVPAAEVESVTVGFGSGAGYPRICLHIRQKGQERPIRLTALQRADTAKSREDLERTAANVRSILALS